MIKSYIFFDILLEKSKKNELYRRKNCVIIYENICENVYAKKKG